MMRHYLDALYIQVLVEAAAVGTTSAGTTAVDMKTCRDAVLIINYVQTDDAVTLLVVEHSSDNVTFTTHTSVGTVADGMTKVNLKNIKRYVRLTYTNASATGNDFWCVMIAGFNAQEAPVS